MATLFAVYVSGECIHRCDAKCYDSHTPTESCKCVCGGDNHGVGLSQAINNTITYAAKWQRDFMAENPHLAGYTEFKAHRYRVLTQLSLFPGMEFEAPILD